MSRLAPFAKILAERQRFKNLPFLVIVCAGRDAWRRARGWNASLNDVVALIWSGDRPPNAYCWPVSRCLCVVDWDIGPTADQITGLIKALLQSGAACVASRPLFTNPEKPAWHYDPSKPIGNRWTQSREMVRTFPGRGYQGGRNVI